MAPAGSISAERSGFRRQSEEAQASRSIGPKRHLPGLVGDSVASKRCLSRGRLSRAVLEHLRDGLKRGHDILELGLQAHLVLPDGTDAPLYGGQDTTALALSPQRARQQLATPLHHLARAVRSGGLRGLTRRGASAPLRAAWGRSPAGRIRCAHQAPSRLLTAVAVARVVRGRGVRLQGVRFGASRAQRPCATVPQEGNMPKSRGLPEAQRIPMAQAPSLPRRGRTLPGRSRPCPSIGAQRM